MDTENIQKNIDALWEQAVNYYQAQDYANSLEIAKEIEKMKTFSSHSVYELIAANAFMLGDFKLALSACESAFARDKKSQNASLQFVNVWTRIENAANYMLEKNENIYEVPFPKITLTIQEVIDLLHQLKGIEAAIYSIGLPKIEELRWKLSLQNEDRKRI